MRRVFQNSAIPVSVKNRFVFSQTRHGICDEVARWLIARVLPVIVNFDHVINERVELDWRREITTSHDAGDLLFEHCFPVEVFAMFIEKIQVFFRQAKFFRDEFEFCGDFRFLWFLFIVVVFELLSFCGLRFIILEFDLLPLRRLYDCKTERPLLWQIFF